MARVENRQTFHRSAHTDDIFPAPAPQLSSLSVAQRDTSRRTEAGSLSVLQEAVGHERFAEDVTLFTNEEISSVAFDITSAFESGGNIAALQTKDSGIISFGRHQATLVSGALAAVIKQFSTLSSSPAAMSLIKYQDRLDSNDPTLKGEPRFLALLRQACTDDESSMRSAQDKVFGSRFWEPAVSLANACGFKSPLGKALCFDTKVQGGCEIVIRRTAEALIAELKKEKLLDSSTPEKVNSTAQASGIIRSLLEGGIITERDALNQFVAKRRDFLLHTAASKKAKGDTVTASYLTTSADYRIRAFAEMLEAGNLSLRGALIANGRSVPGINPEQSAIH